MASITHVAADFQRWISSIAVVLVDDIAVLWRAVEGLAAWRVGVNVGAAPLGLQAAMSCEQHKNISGKLALRLCYTTTEHSTTCVCM
jgi:hypothetical protein